MQEKIEVHPLVTDDGKVLALPPGWGAVHLETALQRYAQKPAYRRSSTVALTPDGFVQAIVGLANSVISRSVVYVNAESAKFVAVIDDNDTDDAGRGCLRVKFSPAHSAQYAAWMAMAEGYHPLQEMAEFLDDRIGDVKLKADATRLMNAALGMTATSKTKVISANRRDNGAVHFEYNQDIDAGINNSKAEIPREFLLSIPVFEGLPKQDVPMRFKYRLSDGNLVQKCEVIDCAMLEREAVDAVAQVIRKGLPPEVEMIAAMAPDFADERWHEHGRLDCIPD